MNVRAYLTNIKVSSSIHFSSTSLSILSHQILVYFQLRKVTLFTIEVVSEHFSINFSRLKQDFHTS